MQLPARIGKYELQEFLGGGMARVYRARDTVIGRTVALKILTEEGSTDPEIKSRFLQEARLAGNIAHDNIISIYDFGEDEHGRPYMVMEFLKGQDLRHAIQSGSTGDLRNKLRTALELARALEYIHSQHIIHRDIKPDNVHITTAGAVKLMDFGISKQQDSTRTRTGIVMGTPYYMAPEQVLGKGVTEQVDVYAFGVLLFELMCGAKPITGDTVERIFYCILQEPLNVEPLRQAAIPEAVVELVGRCTEKDPARRPQGFGAVCAMIQHILAGQDVPAGPAVAGPRVAAPPGKKPWLIPVAALGLAAILVVAYFALRSHAPAVAPPQKAELPQTLDTPTGEMVLVPAGAFLFGEKRESVSLPAFYIDQTEVTAAAYAKFCQAKNRPFPAGVSTDHPDYPVVDITIVDAQEFAKWAGKRLPSMREWEKAARGADGRPYPWGDERDPTRANVKDNPQLEAHALMPASSFGQGASPSHALGMVGNVWEFVDELRTPSPQAVQTFAGLLSPPPGPEEPWYAIRGGSFNEPLSENLLYDWTTTPARYHAKNIGFRCARTP